MKYILFGLLIGILVEVPQAAAAAHLASAWIVSHPIVLGPLVGWAWHRYGHHLRRVQTAN